jgi:hypothetical protein
MTGYFIFDVPRDPKTGEPIDQTPKPIVRCPQCNARMQYYEDLQEHICEKCAYSVRDDYGQTGLPAELEEFTVRRDRNEKPPFYVKSFSSESGQKTISEDLISNRGEDNKKYVGSSQDALREELGEFNSRAKQERDDDLRDIYNDSQGQGTEHEILKYRAERERKRQAEEDT